MALMVPPLPAVSRPSKTMQYLRPRVLHPLLNGDELSVQSSKLVLVLFPLHLALAVGKRLVRCF